MVDRLSVTVPSKLGRELRRLAKLRKTTVSQVVADAVAHQVRVAALEAALHAADLRFGPVPADAVAKAEAEFVASSSRASAPRRAARPR